MPNNVKGAVKIAAAFLGCIIGAGFASGQEVLIYFATYKQNGIIGIIISLCIFLLLLFCLNLYLLKHNLSDFKIFIDKIMNKKLSKIWYIVFFIFTFVTYGVMATGFGAAVNQQTNVNNYIGFIIYIVIMSIVLLFNQEGIVYVNLILTPIMIIGILGLSVYAVFNINTSVFYINAAKTLVPPWVISAALYTGYNSITGIAVICELGNFIYNKKTAIISAAMSIFIFGLLLFFMYAPLSANLTKIKEFEIPMLFIASIINNQVGRIYFMVLLMAMLTTGAGCGYVMCQGMNFSRNTSIVIINLGIIPFMFFDFSSLVQNLYGLFGFFGLILICVILYKTIIKERIFK